jgi:hypothetical protein
LKRYFTGKPCKRGHVSERNIHKTCLECLSGYYMDNRDTIRARAQTPERRAVKAVSSAKWWVDNADHVRAQRMKWKFNIPTWMDPYIHTLKTTGYCPGCGVKLGHPKSPTRACIDHDHDTGEVRMIICNICNTTRLFRCDDGRNPDALLLAAGRWVKRGGRAGVARAIIQLRLAALLLAHYAPQSPLV